MRTSPSLLPSLPQLTPYTIAHIVFKHIMQLAPKHVPWPISLLVGHITSTIAKLAVDGDIRNELGMVRSLSFSFPILLFLPLCLLFIRAVPRLRSADDVLVDE